jgi:hypothetical protein
VKVRAPQEFVTVPQKSVLGLSGRAQQVPGPALPVVLHAKPPPHDVDEQAREPHEFVTVVLHAAPLPPQVGNAQQVPGLVLSGWSHCWPEAQLQVRVPPQPSLI